MKTPTSIGELLDRYDAGERIFLNCNFEFHESLQEMIFDNCVLDGTKFNAASFSECSFNNASLKGCVFTNCHFRNVDFRNSNLSHSVLTGANFADCKFGDTIADNIHYFGHILNTDDFFKSLVKIHQ